MEHRERLVRLYECVYSRPKAVKALKIVGAVATAWIAFSFAYALFVLVFVGEFISAVKLAVFAGVPFCAVSLMRSLINFQRPYELLEVNVLSEMAKDRKRGRSFPSRHVFSAFLIGVLWMPYSPYVGAVALILGSYLAIERVLLGIHFVKDVLAGAAIGIISGLIGTLLW